MRFALSALVLAITFPGPILAQTGMDAHGLEPTGKGAFGDRLEPGSNSFTEEQVRAKFDTMGFGEITDLRKDDQGIWRGSARHAGKPVRIGLDDRGHVAAE